MEENVERKLSSTKHFLFSGMQVYILLTVLLCIDPPLSVLQEIKPEKDISKKEKLPDLLPGILNDKL